MRMFSLLLVLFLVATSCAGTQRYSTGIPASASDTFYFHMEKEVLERGYTATRSDSLSVDVGDGFLQYSIFSDEITLLITVRDAREMTPEELATKQANLKALSDDLVAAARERAETANVSSE